MSEQEKLNLTPELNGSDRNLLLCEEGILKGVSPHILRSKYGEFTFGSFYDPISDTLGNCLIDLENEYTPGLAKSLIDETLKVDPGSNYLRLRAPEFQSSEVQELINSYLANAVTEPGAVINSQPGQRDDYLENLIMSIAEQCNVREIPAAIAIFLPNKKN